MAQENKELLLKDLCARLPYNVLVHIYDIDVCDYDNYLCEDYLGKFRNNFIRIKPYLRSMSSMTEEERKMQKGYIYHFTKDNLSDYEGNFVFEDEVHEYIDWLNKHHFDYRGLIENGLALEAPEDMYKMEKQQ